MSKKENTNKQEPIIWAGHTYKKWFSKYGSKNSNLEIIDKLDVESGKKKLHPGTWWFIDGKYYEIPKTKLSKKAKGLIIAGTILILCAAIVTPISIWAVDQNSVSNVTLDKNVVQLNKGESFSLNATTDPVDANPKKIIWSSENEEIIKMIGSSQKECSFLSSNIGSTKVYAKLSNGKASAECVVNVDPVIENISIIPPTKLTYKVGEAFDTTGLKVKATFVDGTNKEYTTGYTCGIEEGYVFVNDDIGSKDIIVNFKEFSSNFLINVTEASLQNITIDTLPTDTEYIVGETLNLNGIEVNAHYSDGTIEPISNYSVYMEGREKSEASDPRTVSFTSSEVGNKTITLTYKEVSATFGIVIKGSDVTLTNISINKTQEKYRTSFYVGEYLDLTGLQVQATYSDGSTKNVTDSVTQKYIDPSQPDEGIPHVGSEIKSTHDKSFVVTLEYMDKIDETETISVSNNTLDSISVVTNPTKMSYKAGEELDLTGIKAIANFSDGSTLDFTNNIFLYDLSYPAIGYEFTQKDVSNNYPVYIYYGNKGTSFNVSVSGPDLISIDLVEPSLLNYSVGESLNLNGMEVVAHFSDGTYKNVTSQVTTNPSNGYKFTNEDVKDNYEVKVAYGTLTKSFFVKVNEAYVKNIELYAPSKTSYNVGNAFVLTGMHVYAVYSDDSKKEVTGFTSTSIKEGYIFTESDVGQKTVTVTYSTFTDSFAISIENAALVSVEISTKPSKLTFVVGEHFDSAGLQLKLHYSDGKDIYVTDGFTTNFDKYSASSGDYFHNSDISESKTVEVNYAGFTVSYEIVVNTREILVKDGTKISKVYDDYTIHSDFNDANIRIDFSSTFPSFKIVYLCDENGNLISEDVNVEVYLTRYRYDVHFDITEDGNKIMETCSEVYLCCR